MSDLTSFLNHPIETLEKALHLRKQIDALREGLTSLFGVEPPARSATQLISIKTKGKRTMSVAAKAKIAAAQRLRWAKSKGLESATLAGPVKPAPATKAKKGGMSAEGRARIIAAQKLRWAKVKAAKSGSAPSKTTAPSKAPDVKAKRRISAAHRAKLKAAAKARWAKVKKAKG